MINKAFVSDYTTNYLFHSYCCPSKLPKRYPADQQNDPQTQPVGYRTANGIWNVAGVDDCAFG